MARKSKHEVDSGELELDLGETEGAEVEVEAAPETPVSEPVDVLDEQRVEEKPSAQEEAQKADDDNKSEQEEYSASVQKRIDRLTKKMREAERREQEALRYAQNVQGELHTTRQRMTALDQGFVNEYGARIAAQQEQVTTDLKQAREIGDTDAEVSAQKKLAQLAVSADKYAQAQQNAQRRQQQAPLPQQPVYQQPAPAQERPDPKAEDWAEKNEWFGKDEAMTFAAFGIHKGLVEQEEFDPQSDEYYSELDKRIQESFPQKFQNGNGKEKRPAQSVAGVSRTSSGRSGKRVKLTPTQVAIAKKLGVPLEEYAKYVKE
jgi:hypothetical protein